MRNLSLALAVCVSLWPTGSIAVSLGNMTTQSALNERFQADIELEAADAGDLENLQVSLASQNDFARAGLERSFLLTKLKFKVMRSEQGRPIVRVISRGAVREPFLDFLMEISWPKGRVLKHFTALLDPREVPAEQPKVATPTVRSAKTAPPPKPDTIKSAPKIATAERYGPVKKGATLRGIALSLAADKTKVDQVALTLFRNNPNAFVAGKMDGLKAGATLIIPGNDLALLHPKPTDGDAYANRRAGTKPINRTSDENNVRIVPPGGIKLASISRDGGGLPQDEQPEVKQLRSDLRLAQVTIETNRKETEGLRSEIQELKEQLKELHQGIGKKLEQLKAPSVVPASVASESSPPQEPTGAVAQVTPAESPKAQPSVPTMPKDSKVTSVGDEKTPHAGKKPTPPVPTAPVASTSDSWFGLPDFSLPDFGIPNFDFSMPDLGLSELELPKWELPDLKLPELGGLLPGDAAIDKNLDDPVYQAVAGGLLLIILTTMGGLWLMRRRPTHESGLGIGEDSSDIIAPDSVITSSDMLDSSRTSTLTQKSEKLDETSFLSDFSPSDMDDLQQETGQVDPAAEADVYIAYGRYQQAETLLREVLERFPERGDIKVKLLNVYHTTRDVAAFTALVEEMNATGFAKSDPRSWEVICAMGRDLVPGHPLFGASDHRKTEPRRVVHSDMAQKPYGVELDDSSLDSNDTVLSEMPTPNNFEVSAITPKFSPVQTVVTAPVAPGKQSSPQISNKQQSTTAVTRDPLEPQTSIPLSSFDNNHFDTSDLLARDDIDLGDLVSLDLGDESGMIQISPDNPSIATAKILGGQTSSGGDSSGLGSEYYDLESELGNSISLSDLSEDISLAGQLDRPDVAESIETKLDLAQVYMDIDPKTARYMLEEVLQNGDPTQQKIARDMLASID